jgi:hypothetical protein
MSPARALVEEMQPLPLESQLTPPLARNACRARPSGLPTRSCGPRLNRAPAPRDARRRGVGSPSAWVPSDTLTTPGWPNRVCMEAELCTTKGEAITRPGGARAAHQRRLRRGFTTRSRWIGTLPRLDLSARRADAGFTIGRPPASPASRRESTCQQRLEQRPRVGGCDCGRGCEASRTPSPCRCAAVRPRLLWPAR